MNQHEAVIQVMQQNGGYATLGYLYEHVLKIPGVVWKTKTPFASIRRIVQNEKYFFKIERGLWALNTHRKELPFAFLEEEEDSPAKSEFSHTYYQGLLVEVGNYKRLKTFVSHQDKNKKFLDRPLSHLTTLTEILPFSYDKVTRQARTIDVSWFNKREMPDTFIEIEHSTHFDRSLIKFVQLQDFFVDFWIVAPRERMAEFDSRISLSAFDAVKNRVKFLDYDAIVKLHTNMAELSSMQI